MSEVSQAGVSGRYQFGVFEADIESGELRRSGVRVRIQSQPFKVLAALLEQPGALVTREELQHRLWSEGTTVDYDHGLGIAVNKLREALGDSADNPRFVETLARRGYRFLAPVKVTSQTGATEGPIAAKAGSAVGVASDDAAVLEVSPASGEAVRGATAWAGRLSRPLFATSAGVLFAAISLILLTLWLRPDSRRPYTVTQVTFSSRVMTNDLEVRSVSAPVSDGSRIYFINMSNGTPELTEALIANGEMRRLPLPEGLASPLILSISPDGSSLLVRNHQLPNAEEPIWIVETLGGSARRVPGVLGHDAVWMPDGSHLLVATGNSLEELAGDGSGMHPVATLAGPAFWPRWSPDGTALRFTVWSTATRTTELWEAAADFSHLHPLLPGWSMPGSECCGSWTPDGEDFVFQSMHSGHTDLWKIRERPWYRRDWEPQQVTSGPLYSEAPTAAALGNPAESHRIFFVGDNPQIELLEADPNGPGYGSPPLALKAAAFTAFSSDGRRVAWLNAADGSLWSSRVDGTAGATGTDRVELIGPPTRTFNMAWSPDGKQLAVMASPPGAPWKVYLIDSDGGQPRMLLPEDRNEADPTWSPDGKTIVFGRLPDRMDSERLPKAIYQVDVATRRVAEIPGSQGLFSPRISPDGRYIAAVRLDQHALLVFDRTTAKWSTVSTLGVGDPVWSHDGRYLYFQDFLGAGKPIYRIAMPAGTTELVSTIASLGTMPVTDYRLIALAPGDRPVVSARMSNVNLYSLRLD
jgi:Tol biopolymer transport system component/DNA-binding winged helix-turn-helix (wHTH) protein